MRQNTSQRDVNNWLTKCKSSNPENPQSLSRFAPQESGHLPIKALKYISATCAAALISKRSAGAFGPSRRSGHSVAVCVCVFVVAHMRRRRRRAWMISHIYRTAAHPQISASFSKKDAGRSPWYMHICAQTLLNKVRERQRERERYIRWWVLRTRTIESVAH